MPESSDPRQRAKSAFQHAKRAVGMGDPPLATEVGGRVEAVREALRAFGDGDHDRFLSALGEEVEWVGPRGEKFPGSGSCDGRNAVKDRFIGAVERSYTEFGFTPEHYLESPEQNIVVVVGSFGGQGVRGPSQFEAPSVQIWEFDGDKVVGVEIFADSDAFPEAVDEDEPEPGDDEDKDAEDESKDKTEGESEDEAEGENKDKTEGESKDKDAQGESKDKDAQGESKDHDAEASGDKHAGGETTDHDAQTTSDGGDKSKPEEKRETGEAKAESSAN